MVSVLDQSDELGMLYGENGSTAPQNRSSLTTVLEGLTVQSEYFDHLVQHCTL